VSGDFDVGSPAPADRYVTTGPSPIDTIREALNDRPLSKDQPYSKWVRDNALAALTEVEQLIEDEYRRGYDEGEFAGGQADTEGATE
jgi:hypothetical protein